MGVAEMGPPAVNRHKASPSGEMAVSSQALDPT